MDRLTAWANTRNGRSQVALERVGFKREGVLRAFHRHGDVLHDVVVFGMVRKGWMRSASRGYRRASRGRHRRHSPRMTPTIPPTRGGDRHRSRLGSLPDPRAQEPGARVAALHRRPWGGRDARSLAAGERPVPAPRSARHSRCCSPDPATAAAQAPLPVPVRRRRVPSAPSISLPLTVPAAQPCPGARRRSGARARRIAVGCLVNKARTSAGLRGFAWSRALARAATRHARDMARRGYFAHQRSGGPSLGAPRARRRLPRAQRRRGDRLRLRLARHARRDRAHVAGQPAAPGDPAVAAAAAWGSASPAARRVGCGGRGATYVLDAAER